MNALLRNLEVAKDFAQTTFDTTVSTVEGVHGAVANAAHQIIAQGTGDSEKLDALKAKHDETASQVYSTIRDVNRTLGQMVSDYFEAAEDGAHAAKTMAENEADQSNK